MMKKQLLIILILILWANVTFALQPRFVRPKPTEVIFGDGVKENIIELKFVEGTGIRLRDDRFVSVNRTDISEITELFYRYPTVKLERMFNMVSEEKLTQDKIRGEAKSGKELADLNLWYICYLPNEVYPQQFINDLISKKLVEIAYPTPIAKGAKLNTSEKYLSNRESPDFTNLQGYLYASPVGVNAAFAWNFEGGLGDNVKWIDIEGNGFNWYHEDMPEPFFDNSINYGDHGIAVTGIISGKHNDYGVDGIAPNSPVGAIEVVDGSVWPVVAQDIYLAYNNLDEGDVFLLELHSPGPRYNFQFRLDQLGFVCMEYWQSNFDAIQTATSNGVHCTEAAGNGAENFEDEIYGNLFDRNVRDSGAVMCGAATGEALTRLGFSNYGSRLDSFGWGREVVTTGYGDLYGGYPDEWYTLNFGGTSSASPICTGPILCIQGILKAMGEDVLSPIEMRTLLTDTGVPQRSDPSEYIGTRPNLYDALLQIVDTGSISGNIVNAETEEPITNAHVELIMPDVVTYEYASDVDGSFAFDNNFPMEYLLRVTLYGYDVYESTITPIANETTEIQIELTPSNGMATLTGNILDDQGNGINATIRLYQPDTGFELALEEIMLNEDGSFEAFLPSANYDIKAIAEYPYPLRTEYNYNIAPGTEINYQLSPANILLVDDDEGEKYENYFYNPLDNLDEEFYWWDVSEIDGLPTVDALDMLASNPIIIWFTGDAKETAITPEEGDLLIEILDADYALFLIGQNIAEYLDDHPLLIYVDVSYESNIVGSMLMPFGSDDIGGELSPTLITNEPGANNQNSCDILIPGELASPIYYYTNGGQDAIAAVHTIPTEDESYRLVFFGFGFEGICEGNPNVSTPEDVMGSMLNWLKVGTWIHDSESLSLPTTSVLYDNYPNPFNPNTTINFDLAERSNVKLNIYDTSGKLIKNLTNGEHQAGYHSVVWNGTDEDGKDVSSGIYLYRIECKNFNQVKQCLLLK